MLMHDLNPQQKEALLYMDSPLLIFAGAGSGKTKVIAHKFSYLMKIKKHNKESILTVTFTNKAADEMKQRISGLIGKGLLKNTRMLSKDLTRSSPNIRKLGPVSLPSYIRETSIFGWANLTKPPRPMSPISKKGERRNSTGHLPWKGSVIPMKARRILKER